jgi:opacity protein-like surface antigen
MSLDEPLELNSVDRRSRNCFKEGTMVISLGYGVPNLGRSIFKLTEDLYPESTSSGYGPIFAKFEYAVSNKIGLGAVIRIHGASLDYPVEGFAESSSGFRDSAVTYNYKQKISSFAAMFRFNYHFATGKKIDPYVGLGLGYGNTKWTFEDGGDDFGAAPTFSSLIPIGGELTVGMRYFFSDAVGAYAEVGLSKSIANFGLAIKI